MKTIKPQKLSILHHTLEVAGRLDLCVTAMLACPFDAPESPLHEASLWKMLAAELGPDVVPDAGMPKPRAEVLVFGQAYPPGGAQPACSVRLRLGDIDKTLSVVGDRTWDESGAASAPAPFSAMPITWANAFGGPDDAANPVGKGAGERGPTRPLPNIEDPAHLVKDPEDRPRAAGFGPYDVTSPERASRAGTYDDAWLKSRSPELPLDFDLAFYNTAPLDQQRDAPFVGGEVFTLENMHPERPVLEGRLPRFRARIFVKLRGGELREVPMRLETVQLFPGSARMLILFRGITGVTEEDASDVLQLVAACEEPGAPRPVAHYEAVLAERLDRKRGALASLREGDLMPQGPAAKVSLDEIADPDLATPIEHLLRRNMRRKTEREIEEARARIRAAGLDPDEHVPAALPPQQPDPPALDEIEGVVTQAKEEGARRKAEADEKRAAAEAEVRQQCESAGIDHDKKLAELREKQGGPPTFSAAAELEKLQDALTLARNAGVRLPAIEAQLADPELPRRLQATEDGLRDVYRKHAHRLPAAPSAAASLTAQARAELPAGAQGGVSFAGRDLTGADLAGLDLRGVDLRSALLEGAKLAGANLEGADLTGAVLTRADLTGADLTGARLAGCNLGHASLVGAKLEDDVDLSRAILAGADLSGASLRDARLDRTDLGEAILRDTDFGGVVATNLTFMRSDLRGAKLARASFVKCNFIEVDLRGVDLRGVVLTSATLVGVDAGGAVLRGARLTKLCVVQGSSFEGADFTGALLGDANLRATKLAGCDFTRAELSGADLSECDLRGARFDRAIGHEARFTRADLSRASLAGANLMLADFARAKVHGASFLGANLFRTDLSRMDTDDATVMTDAKLTQARIVEARRPRDAR